jgi:archaellum component FlaF (FlaF/FlaG flagellin family)
LRKYRPRGRRGIGTVVTSVMLVSAVSMLGAALVSWSSSSFALHQVGVSEEIDDRVNQLNEGFIVEDVWFFTNSTSSYATVTVRNTGDVAVTVSNIYVNNTQAWNAGKVIASSEVGTVTFESLWSAGSGQDVWLVTQRGTEAKQLWRS